MEELSQLLIKLQSMVVKMWGQSHGYHWNIEGRTFKQDHAFLLEIYEDVFDSIDTYSENLRRLGYKAPFGVRAWDDNSDLEINDSPDLDSRAMFQELSKTNQVIIAMIRHTFDKASELDEQGLCNFLADREDKHKFWQWQLTATLK